jgi:hypothetical protein
VGFIIYKLFPGYIFLSGADKNGAGEVQTPKTGADNRASDPKNINTENTDKSASNGEQLAQKAVDYINKNMLEKGKTATYKDVKEESGLYSFKLAIQGVDYTASVTKDGKILYAEGVPQAIKLDEAIGAANDGKNISDLAKNEKPDIKLFVMSYCPYGLQAEKMYLPVYDLLKDKADFGIYFVNYAMHGKKEVDENLRQYCIQQDEAYKYAIYLKCFIGSRSLSRVDTADYSKCMTSAGIDQGKFDICFAAADKRFNITANYNDKSTWLNGSYPKFEINADLNEKYGIQGSPTIAINGKDVSSSLAIRSPEAFKKLVCSAFNVEPEECKTDLSDDLPSTGFGD